jgi:hypothetical protein
MSQDPERGVSPGGLIAIGWKEYLDFPEWGVNRVKAKVDTGARTSALDVARFSLERRPEGLIARMQLALNRRRPERLVTVETPVLRLVVVTSSDGVREERPVIETAVRLGPIEKRIRLTVTDRSGMLFPMLLGREALAGSCVVDVRYKYLLGKRRHSAGPGV